MQATHYVIHTGTQDIVLHKNAINPGLYWGQQMASESLEKGAQSIKTTAFDRTASVLYNPHSVKNRISWTSNFPIKASCKDSETPSVFKPFVSALDHKKYNITLKRKFKHMRSKSWVLGSTESQTLEPRTSDACSINVSTAVLESSPSKNGSPSKKNQDSICTTQVTTPARKNARSLSSPENAISSKSITFETVLQDLKSKRLEYEPGTALIAKLKSKLERKFSGSDAIRDTSLTLNYRHTESPPRSSSKKLRLSQKEPKEWLGGFLPMNLPSSAKTDNNQQKYELALSTDLDSCNFDLTIRQAAPKDRKQLETKKVLFFGKEISETAHKLANKSNSRRPASAVRGKNNNNINLARTSSSKTLHSSGSKSKTITNTDLDHITEQYKLAESKLANENAIFTGSSFKRVFRGFSEQKIRVNQLQDLA